MISSEICSRKYGNNSSVTKEIDVVVPSISVKMKEMFAETILQNYDYSSLMYSESGISMGGYCKSTAAQRKLQINSQAREIYPK